MSQPTDSLHYVYYKCPNCGDKSDDVRIAETRIGKLCCSNCNTIYTIKPILKVEFVYEQKTESYIANFPNEPNINRSSKPKKSQSLIDSLVLQGYGIREVNNAYDEVLVKSPHLSNSNSNDEELFKQIILELQ